MVANFALGGKQAMMILSCDDKRLYLILSLDCSFLWGGEITMICGEGVFDDYLPLTDMWR